MVTWQATGGCYSLIQDAYSKLSLSFILSNNICEFFLQKSPVAMRTPSSISRVPRGLLAVVFSAAVLRARFAAKGSSCWSHFSSLGDKNKLWSWTNQISVRTVISLNVTWRILWRKTTEYVKVSFLHLVIQCIPILSEYVSSRIRVILKCTFQQQLTDLFSRTGLCFLLILFEFRSPLWTRFVSWFWRYF